MTSCVTSFLHNIIAGGYFPLVSGYYNIPSPICHSVVLNKKGHTKSRGLSGLHHTLYTSSHPDKLVYW